MDYVGPPQSTYPMFDPTYSVKDLRRASHLLIPVPRNIIEMEASSEIFHELYHVFSGYAPLSVVLADAAKVSAIRNLSFVDADYSILMALSILET